MSAFGCERRKEKKRGGGGGAVTPRVPPLSSAAARTSALCEGLPLLTRAGDFSSSPDKLEKKESSSTLEWEKRGGGAGYIAVTCYLFDSTISFQKVVVVVVVKYKSKNKQFNSSVRKIKGQLDMTDK